MKRSLSKTAGGTLIVCSILFSCASTPKTTTTTETIQPTTQIETKAEELPPPPAPKESEIYAAKISEINLSLVATPKETTKGKSFTSPYILKAENKNGQPVESLEISVSYPSSRKNGEIIFSETTIATNSEGKAEFLPSVPEFSFNSEISFYPKADITETCDENEKLKIAELSKSCTINAPFKVQTDQKSAGGVIAVVDFNQNEKPVLTNPVSCQNILMTLMKLGFTRIGNAPQDVMNAVIQNEEQKIHATAKPYANSFIIYGSVKIDSLEKTENGVTYTLTGLVKSMTVKTGEVIFSTQKTVQVTDKNEWNALANARKEMADAIANEIKYGI